MVRSADRMRTRTSTPATALAPLTFRQPPLLTLRTQSQGIVRSPEWCSVVNRTETHAAMKSKQGSAKGMKAEHDTASIRASISFPQNVYRTLQDIAHQKKVSLAWVVREASERYTASERAPARRTKRKADRA